MSNSKKQYGFCPLYKPCATLWSVPGGWIGNPYCLFRLRIDILEKLAPIVFKLVWKYCICSTCLKTNASPTPTPGPLPRAGVGGAGIFQNSWKINPILFNWFETTWSDSCRDVCCFLMHLGRDARHNLCEDQLDHKEDQGLKSHFLNSSSRLSNHKFACCDMPKRIASESFWATWTPKGGMHTNGPCGC